MRESHRTSCSAGAAFGAAAAAAAAERRGVAVGRTVRSACQFCNSNCGLRVDVRQGRVLRVSGEPDDPVQAGRICVKAPMMAERAYNERRFTTPLVRRSGAKGAPETVFVPNTFGPAQEVGDVFGTPRSEAANTLLDDRFHDNLSGRQAYKCFACRVRRA